MAKGGRFEHGSVLGGKTRTVRVSSQWKSTGRAYNVALGPSLTARFEKDELKWRAADHAKFIPQRLRDAGRQLFRVDTAGPDLVNKRAASNHSDRKRVEIGDRAPQPNEINAKSRKSAGQQRRLDRIDGGIAIRYAHEGRRVGVEGAPDRIGG